MSAFAEPEIEKRLVKAWGRAVVSAHNRAAPLVTAEDLLVGLFEEYGELLFNLLTSPEAVRAVIEHIRASRVRHYDYPYPPGEDSPKASELNEPYIGFLGLAPSLEYAALMVAVKEEMESGHVDLFTLVHFMRILAQSDAAKRLATEHDVCIRPLGSAESPEERPSSGS
jgi:hypothetical protein